METSTANAADHFYSLSSLNLLPQQLMYPPVGHLLGLRGLLRHDYRFLGVNAAAAAAFLPGEVPHDAAGLRPPYDLEDDGGSPVNLCTSNTLETGLPLDPPSWSPFSCNGPMPPAAPAVGVFQRLLALMSHRASALDNLQKRNAQQSLLDRQYATNSPDYASTGDHEQQNLVTDRSEADASEPYPYWQ